MLAQSGLSGRPDWRSWPSWFSPTRLPAIKVSTRPGAGLGLAAHPTARSGERLLRPRASGSIARKVTDMVDEAHGVDRALRQDGPCCETVTSERDGTGFEQVSARGIDVGLIPYAIVLKGEDHSVALPQTVTTTGG